MYPSSHRHFQSTQSARPLLPSFTANVCSVSTLALWGKPMQTVQQCDMHSDVGWNLLHFLSEHTFKVIANTLFAVLQNYMEEIHTYTESAQHVSSLKQLYGTFHFVLILSCGQSCCSLVLLTVCLTCLCRSYRGTGIKLRLFHNQLKTL